MPTLAGCATRRHTCAGVFEQLLHWSYLDVPLAWTGQAWVSATNVLKLVSQMAELGYRGPDPVAVLPSGFHLPQALGIALAIPLNIAAAPGVQ